MKIRLSFDRSATWIGWRYVRPLRALSVQPVPCVGIRIEWRSRDADLVEIASILAKQTEPSFRELFDAVQRLRCEVGLEDAEGFMCNSNLLARLRAVEFDLERTLEEDSDCARAHAHAGTSKLRKRFAEIGDRLQAVAVVADRADVLYRSWGDAKLLSRVAELEANARTVFVATRLVARVAELEEIVKNQSNAIMHLEATAAQDVARGRESVESRVRRLTRPRRKK